MTKLTTLAGLVLALALVTGSAAAMPGAAPAGADDAAQDDQNATETEREAGPPADAGPPASLPDQVPGFVGDIHDLIRGQMDGGADGDLGSRISDLTPGGA